MWYNVNSLAIESLQNTSHTKGSSVGGNISIGITNMGAVSGNIHGSKTKGNGEFVDKQSSFVVGEKSNLKIGDVENTAAILGSTENGKIQIDKYTGNNLENKQDLKTVGGSIGTSGVGIQYANSEKEGITRNTVLGNVSIEKAEGDSINTDLSKANEMTKDDSFSTNLYAEKQLIESLRSPEAFQEKVQKATQELQDMKRVVVDTIENKGKDDRNFLEILSNQRRGTALRNLLASDLHEILQHSSNIQGDTKVLLENFGKDLGLDVKVIFAEGDKLPKESQSSKGSAYVNGTSKETTIVIDTSKIRNTKEFIGTSMEELSHIIDKVAGRQDEKVAEDETNDEKGLESLGRPINNYFQEEFASSNQEIRLQPDGKDYSKLDLGEKVGDVAVGFSVNVAGSFIGRVNVGRTSYLIYNPENKEIEYAKTTDIGIGLGVPGISAGGSTVILFNVNTAKELEGHSFVRGGGAGNVGFEGIMNDTKKMVGLRLGIATNPIKVLLKGAIKPATFDAYGSVDSTIVTKHFNLSRELEIEKKLIKLDQLVKNSKGIMDNVLEIYFLTESLKKDLSQWEGKWKYKPIVR